MRIMRTTKTGRFVGIAGQMAFLALLGAALGACDPGEGPAGEEIEGAPGELSLSSVIFDGPGRPTNTTCNGMHCCPPGYVMVGAHLSSNTCACAYGYDRNGSTQYDNSRPVQFDAEYVDAPGGTYTTRNGMHSCLAGYVMVGYSQYWNALMCKRPVNPALNMISEYIDYGSLINAGGYNMHACNQNGIANPYRYAMTGIHAGLNRFACTY